MRYILQSLKCLLLIFIISSCKKSSTIEDRFIEEAEQLSVLELKAAVVGQNFIEINWNKTKSSRFKEVSYSIDLNGQRIIQGLKTNKYSLINLNDGQEYIIKVTASTKDGLKTEEKLVAKTLPAEENQTEEVLYKEYNIHSYSKISPLGLAQLADGGHLFISFLEHSNDFPKDNFKLMVFRIDSEGNFLWYRLLSAYEHGISYYTKSNIILHNNDKEGIIFSGSYAFKISTNNGEILLEKDFKDIDNITSVFNASPQHLLVGTEKGHLISLYPTDLSVQWKQENQNKLGGTVAINLDSKKNIYAAYRNKENAPPFRILKYDNQGSLLNSLQINGVFLSGSLIIHEDDNLGFITSHSDSYYNRLYYYKFNNEGILINQKEIPDAVTSARVFLNDKNEIIVYGTRHGNSLTMYGGILTFDKEMNIKSRLFYTELPFHGLVGVTPNANNSYNLFLGYAQTYSYENFNFVFIKTKIGGSI